ncbi:MAG: TerB family tellurite resistance protein [Paludibacteraceae bacterium]|nr:TerB family tellurite resistance protein [Paludibacteraceae bacterium]MBR1786406.1 TerB family tellurite resistance protein [Paludibacteraceae bacterium]
MKLSTLIGGGIGFALFGPIGAIIGAIIGSAIGNMLAQDDDDNEPISQEEQPRGGRVKTTPADVRLSILILIAAVLKADGHVRKVELDKVKVYLRQLYKNEQEAQEALLFLRDAIKQDFHLDQVLAQIRVYTNYSTRLTIVQILLDVAYSDGYFERTEQNTISYIANYLGITQADYTSLLSMFVPTERSKPDWAYKALEISPDATEDEIKKAYRRMAMKHHPDKVATLGEEMKRKANEKFQEIHKAYEYIKQERGIK